MKKTLLILSLFVATCAKAQTTFGINGSIIGANMTSKSDDPDEDFGDFKTRLSWSLGVTARVPLSERFVFLPQLNLLSKGGKFDETTTEDIGGGQMVTFQVKGDAKLNYLELPLNFVYQSNKFFIGAGPSVSYGLGGDFDGRVTYTFMGQTESESFSANVKFDGKKSEDTDDEAVHLKALEFGANFITGYTLNNGIAINAKYNHGLSNIDPNEGSESKNRYFGLGVIYFFSRK